MKRSIFSMSVLMFIVFLATACSGYKEGQPANQEGTGKAEQAAIKPDEPVTLNFYRVSGGWKNEDEFNQFVVDPISKKFPNTTLKYVTGKLPDLVAAGNTPDIFVSGIRQLGGENLAGLDVPLDLRDLVKKNNLDLGSYDKLAVDTIKNYGQNGEFYALPLWNNFYITAYNKSIFDKFGVPYPKDSMTWNEMYDLAKKMTRLDGGTQYKGLQPGTPGLLALGKSLAFVNSKTDKANVTTDDWINLYTFLKQVYSIPGNEPTVGLKQEIDSFVKDKNIAVVTWYGSFINQLVQVNSQLGFDWDLTTFPSFQGYEGRSGEFDMDVLEISRTGKYKDQAFRVIQYLSTDPTFQTNIAKRGGTLPAIKMDNLLDVLGADFPILKSKNLKGIFKSTPGMGHLFNKYDTVVSDLINSQFTPWLKQSVDANTQLRIVEEMANQKIEEMKK